MSQCCNAGISPIQEQHIDYRLGPVFYQVKIGGAVKTVPLFFSIRNLHAFSSQVLLCLETYSTSLWYHISKCLALLQQVHASLNWVTQFRAPAAVYPMSAGSSHPRNLHSVLAACWSRFWTPASDLHSP
jgi:hypothetical protein